MLAGADMNRRASGRRACQACVPCSSMRGSARLAAVACACLSGHRAAEVGQGKAGQYEGGLVLPQLVLEGKAGRHPAPSPAISNLPALTMLPAQVHFCRKAQALAAQLHLRWRGVDARFRFADMDQLSADSGVCVGRFSLGATVKCPFVSLVYGSDACRPCACRMTGTSRAGLFPLHAC